MGKDRSGKYHPPKGKPSGAAKDEGLGLHPTDPEKLDQYLDITDKYTTGEDEMAAHVPVRHPNRNTEKGHSRFKNQQDSQDSRRSDDLSPSESATPVVAQELPKIVDKKQFAELAAHKSDHCISIFLPTHTAGVEVNERFDPLTFKKALQDVSSQLKEKGLSQGEIGSLLEPGYTLLQNDSFWLNMNHGLAVFISKGYFSYMKLPVVTEQDTVIDSSFFVTPLTQLFTSREYFYIMTLSKKQIKLFRADAFGITFVDVPGLPEGMLDAQAADKDDETTFRMGGRGGTGGANFHGVGGGNNVDDKAKITTYFEAADRVLWKEVFSSETAPLLLAGVEYLIPLYKSVTNYKNIVEDFISGNRERDDAPTLYSLAMEKMAPHFSEKLAKARDLYGNQSGTSLTSTSVKEIIPAAYYGKVSHLFVLKGQHIWGSFDEMKNELRLHSSADEGGEDLLDNAVEKALLTGAEVYLVDKEQMPAEGPLVAIMRY